MAGATLGSVCSDSDQSFWLQASHAQRGISNAWRGSMTDGGGLLVGETPSVKWTNLFEIRNLSYRFRGRNGNLSNYS